MRLYRIPSGVLLERGLEWIHLEKMDWDAYVNDDNLYAKMSRQDGNPVTDPRSVLASGLLPPLQSQELWAAGVTYIRSKVGRQEEAEAAGGGDFYARVYEAERPELFFKATAHRIVGSGGKVRIRKDSTWNVPEPELTLVMTSSGSIVGYTIGNDMSSRSIEGENPLYLPQAKTYDACASVGPCVYVTRDPLPQETLVLLEINRDRKKVFEGSVELHRIKRTFKELVSFLYRECTFPHGSLLMTGTGIVPSSDFTLKSGDTIAITIDPIGTLVNTVE